MKKTEKESLDSLLATLAWTVIPWRVPDDSTDFALWKLMQDTVTELAKKVGGPVTREMLSGRVSPKRRAARRRLLRSKLVRPPVTGSNQYAVTHRGLYTALVKGGFETVQDVVSVDPSEFYRLEKFGDRCRIELTRFLMDLMKQDLRFDTRVGSYRFGYESNEVTREQLEPLERQARELNRQWELLDQAYDKLYGDDPWGSRHSGKTMKLVRSPFREKLRRW